MCSSSDLTYQLLASKVLKSRAVGKNNHDRLSVLDGVHQIRSSLAKKHVCIIIMSEQSEIRPLSSASTFTQVTGLGNVYRSYGDNPMF